MPRRGLCLAGLLVILQGGVSPVCALDPERAMTQYIHQLWQTDHGLPQNTIRDIAQTPDGYLWFGTQAGLVRFDGVRFRVFNRHNTEALENDQIYALLVDGRGDLWIGTHGGGLLRYRDRHFERFGVESGLPSEKIASLAVGADGALWVGTYDQGLARWSDGRAEVFDARHGISSGVIYALAADASGGCWAGVLGGGVHYLAEGAVTSYSAADDLASDFVWDVYLTSDGTLWTGTNRGLHRFRDGRWEIYTTADGLAHNWIKSILEDRDGNLWIGTMGGGLHRWSPSDRLDLLTAEETRSGDVIWSLFEDREGSLWFGTLSGGLNQLQEGPFLAYSRQEGLSSRQVHAVLEGDDGALWIATNNGGLNRFREGRFDTWRTADGLSVDTNWALHFDRTGSLWIGTGGAGVDRFRDGVWANFSTRDGLGHDRVLAIEESRNGDLWFATERGLSRYRRGAFATFTTADGLVHDQVYALHEGPSGVLWIGTSGGLSAFDGERFTNYTITDGLSHERIWHLHEDADGALWIGTFGGGLNRFRDGRFTSFTTADGLYSDDITSIVDDGAGFFWLASTRGIFRLAKGDLEAYAEGRLERIDHVAFGRQDGLKSSECFGGAPIGLRAQDGRLWFSTMDGIATVDPPSIGETPAPGVILEDVEVDGASVLAPSQPELTVVGGQSFVFRYTAATLRAPAKIRFRFRLLGFDPRWSEVGARRDAYFTNLDPGSYTFEVMASDRQGRFTGQALAYSFSIRPRFTQTTAFYGLCAAGLVALGFGLQQVRVRQLRRRQAELTRAADEAMARVKTLRGLLPICAQCKNIRDDEGYWERLETYIDRHSEASFTHGLCPSCADQVMESWRRESP